MDNIQEDSVKMKQEVETTQLNQSVKDTSVPHLVVGIKQELDNETKDDIQSQLPFLADKIKQEQMSIKSEEITSFEDMYMKVRKVDSFDETMTELTKVEQPDLHGEDVGMHIKKEMCAFTWSYCADAHTDVWKMNSSDNGQHSQLVGHDTVSEKLPEVIRKTEKNADVEKGLERLLVHVKKIVKNTGNVADDLCRLPEHIQFEKNTGNEARNFEMMHEHTENTIIKAENKTGYLCLTSRDQSLNESVKVSEYQVMHEDMANITGSDGNLSLNNGEDRKLSDNAFCVSKKDTKHNVSTAGSDELSSYNVCGVGFITFGNLNIHKKKHTGGKPYKCDICGKGFTQKSSLNVHTKIHTGEKPYKCDVCGKGFTNISYLNTHKMIHRGEKHYKCGVCGKGFINTKNLNAHTRIHTGEKPYKCDVCDQGFIKTSKLKVHKRKCHGEKPYKCDVCGKQYINTRTLNAHTRIHTGERPYKCAVCGKGFTQDSNLHAHKKIHTGEKLYMCDVCGKSFTYICNFKRHKIIHTGEKSYKCDVCGKGFTQNSSLNIHKIIHARKKPYKCDICGSGFTQTSSVNAHKRTHEETLQV